MRDLQKAISEEKLYIEDRANNIDTSLIARIKQYGYETLDEYFKEKRKYLFENWKPEVYYVDIRTLSTELEKAVQNEKYGIYISVADTLYAFHGDDEIDHNLCKELGVCVAEVYHKGGTIIGSDKDLGIEIVAPRNLSLQSKDILNKFYEIISYYEDNVIISGNDILVNGEKVLGSMRRDVGNVFVWAAQCSFGEYDDIIEKICHKKSQKKPGRLKNPKLSKEVLEKEVLKWLLKK